MSENPTKQCRACGADIPAARIKALPHTQTCVSCSGTQRVAGFQVISGKTSYSEIEVVPQDKAQELYKLQDRKGSIATGVLFKELPPPKLSNFE